ncbi:Uncharacterised protein [Vibrio cholerae]|nr:Uncharacterised protein [Vibrio cholerae]
MLQRLWHTGAVILHGNFKFAIHWAEKHINL